ncbi:MAG: hypothetical protein A2075_22095 [Geobacteraceae bacterium GWC2_58_44]|nr:MAG: hypothetical protein A2075_22095 [Geobacteraceae bacterium GWC2_58_44]HBG07055.1 hypothetical protein [Geobacter sp.]
MFKRVSRLFRKRTAGLSLLVAGLLALTALVAAPSSASAATGAVTTTHWKSGSTEGYSLDATVSVSAGLGLADVKLSGAGISTPVDLIADSLEVTTYRASIPLASRPAIGAAYTLTVSYLDSTTVETLPVTVSNVIDAFATPATPVGAVGSSAQPTFRWTAPATLPANFLEYGFSLTGSDFQWGTNLSATETPYGGTLAPAVLYNWSVSVLDANGNRSENRVSFMLGANFSGKVTDLNGVGLAGVSIDVFDTVGNAKPRITTQSDGSYIYGGLAAGSYKVLFSTDTTSVYYNNRLDEPSLLPVATGVVTTNVNAILGGWGAISGSVFLKDKVAIQVALYDANRARVTSVPVVNIPAGASSTFGSYYLSLIRPGNYYVKFTAQGYPEVWTPLTPVTVNGTSLTFATITSGIPTITNFTVAATSASLTVTGISVTATETNGIGGYLLTESATPPAATAGGWSTTPPTSYAFTGVGARTLYAWAKGTAGVVSASVSRTVNVTVARTVAVQTTGLGSGSVNSNPSGIACLTGSTAGCSASFAGGSTVTLIPYPSLSSVFSGWSGACTGTGNCQLTIDAAKSVTASFAVRPPPVRIDGRTTPYFTVDGALDAILTVGQTVRAKNDTFVENVIMTSPVPILLKGGFTDAAFSTRTTTSFTVVDGTLKIQKGKLTVERLKVR